MTTAKAEDKKKSGPETRKNGRELLNVVERIMKIFQIPNVVNTPNQASGRVAILLTPVSPLYFPMPKVLDASIPEQKTLAFPRPIIVSREETDKGGYLHDMTPLRIP
jgi:hypothetical protein